MIKLTTILNSTININMVGQDVGIEENSDMTETLIEKIKNEMKEHLTAEQMRQLHTVLVDCCLMEAVEKKNKTSDLIKLFLAAKRVEGCSDKTVKYYESTLKAATDDIKKNIVEITTDDLRIYLDNYQSQNKISMVTIDNIR